MRHSFSMTTCGGMSYGQGAPRLLPRTTHADQAELQRSKASVAALGERFRINRKMVLKWRKRASVKTARWGLKRSACSVEIFLTEV
jgi:hypothetical protein